MPTKKKKKVAKAKRKVVADTKQTRLKCPKCKKYYYNKRKVCTHCGRDWKLTPEIEKELERALRLDYPVEKACVYVGIAKSSFYSWLKNFPEFAEKMRRAKHFASKIARTSVIKHMAKDGNLALKYLERKEKDEFSTKQVVQEQSPTKELDLDEKRDIRELAKQEGFEYENLDDLEELMDLDF